jgi:hypothetical protein
LGFEFDDVIFFKKKKLTLEVFGPQLSDS